MKGVAVVYGLNPLWDKKNRHTRTQASGLESDERVRENAEKDVPKHAEAG